MQKATRNPIVPSDLIKHRTCQFIILPSASSWVGTDSGHHCLAQCYCSQNSNGLTRPVLQAANYRGTSFLYEAPATSQCTSQKTITLTLQRSHLRGHPSASTPSVKSRNQELDLSHMLNYWNRQNQPRDYTFPQVAMNTSTESSTINKLSMNLAGAWEDPSFNSASSSQFPESSLQIFPLPLQLHHTLSDTPSSDSTTKFYPKALRFLFSYLLTPHLLKKMSLLERERQIPCDITYMRNLK